MMQTPFGELMVFDAHTHFFSKSFYAKLGSVAGIREDSAAEVARRLGWDSAPDDPTEITEKWIREMDQYGVDRIVAIHALPGDLDAAGQAVLASSERLAGYAMVNPKLPSAATSLEKAVKTYGFCGLALFPAMFHFDVRSDRVSQLLEIAHRYSLNVFVHCGVLKVGFGAELGVPANFDCTFANPLALQVPCATFPKAKFIVPHLGAGYLRELLMLADLAPNVYTDTSGFSGWARYLEGAPERHTVLRQAIDVMGADRVLFGTDSSFFPRGWRNDIFEQQMQVFQQAGVTAEEAGKILGQNLERLTQ